MVNPNSDPLLQEEDLENVCREEESENTKPKNSYAKYLLMAAGILFLLIVGGFILAFSSSNIQSNGSFSNLDWPELPGTEILEGMSCANSETSEIEESKHGNMWNTPPRGKNRWLPGFQDMSTLTGYASLNYAEGRKSCTVTIITRTAKELDLSYEFDGEMQKSNSKTFDSSFDRILRVRVVAASGETLELSDIDFIWNNAPIKERPGDFRNGQKGAIIEMFGWPDKDIQEECQFIADAGYLGVKVFPHQEQVMSYQPFENELNPWYFMYQPVSYRLDGRMGSRNDLREMIQECRKVGVRVYADAVVNHMTGNGNDLSNHRNGNTKWGNKTSSAEESLGSPYYTPAYTYETNPFTGRGTNVLEFPAVPYGPADFHCDKALNAWTNPFNLNTGWLTGLSDLNTGSEYVRQRICDFFVDLLSIGFSGFRIDAAKHIHPTDLASIFGKLKRQMGGSLPEDFITWLEVLTGGESWLLVQDDSDYSFTAGLTKRLQAEGLTDDEILQIKIWWAGYPVEYDNDRGTISPIRKVIQNDDHDQQNDGSSSRDMHDDGSVLVKDKDPAKHRKFEKKLFLDPMKVEDNDNDAPIRLVLSSYYFDEETKSKAPPDGKSDCDRCTTTCEYCRTRKYAKAHVDGAVAYEGTDYTRVHRDAEIIAAMREWMHIN